ncbi:MAG TPA: hypothetical protein VFV86_06260, partial [Nitrososphaeraceae archaeon]|nr:hypothetical protein [Nitrososphaeraceae archaeon]
MRKIQLSEYNNILIQYNKNQDRKYLAKLYNVTVATINDILFKLGISKPLQGNGARKYSFNYNYFDIIDTEDKAYFLGLLYADGNNCNKRGVVRLELQSSDVNILEKFNKYIDNHKPIRYTNKHNYNKAEIELVSKSFSFQLSKLGCVPNKSLILRFPTEYQVPYDLTHHFVRGYFDGDGCLSSSIPKRCTTP